MQEHFIELSNRYSIKVSDAGKYIIYKIELQENGTYERVGGRSAKICLLQLIHSFFAN